MVRRGRVAERPLRELRGDLCRTRMEAAVCQLPGALPSRHAWSRGLPDPHRSFIAQLRGAFAGTFIASGGLDRAKAEALLASGAADLVAFGRPVLANPDFVTRIQGDQALNAPDLATFYTPGEVGYLDYPTLALTEMTSAS